VDRGEELNERIVRQISKEGTGKRPRVGGFEKGEGIPNLRGLFILQKAIPRGAGGGRHFEAWVIRLNRVYKKNLEKRFPKGGSTILYL